MGVFDGAQASQRGSVSLNNQDQTVMIAGGAIIGILALILLLKR